LSIAPLTVTLIVLPPRAAIAASCLANEDKVAAGTEVIFFTDAVALLALAVAVLTPELVTLDFGVTLVELPLDADALGGVGNVPMLGKIGIEL
jgi:hypothetical protein